jgi:hypothetical protein
MTSPNVASGNGIAVASPTSTFILVAPIAAQRGSISRPIASGKMSPSFPTPANGSSTGDVQACSASSSRNRDRTCLENLAG